MTRALLSGLSLCLLLTACGIKPVGPVPPGMEEDRYAALQLYASRNLNCPREKLAYETFGKGRHLFKGCDERIEMLMLTGADAEAHGYAKGFVVPSAADRFSKEVKCGIETTAEERIDHRTHVVEGCGKRITYVLACNPNCSWIANVESERR